MPSIPPDRDPGGARPASGGSARAAHATTTDGATAEGASAGQRPTRVGRYRVTGEIGRGGMGVVLRGFDEHLARDVAIKLLAPGRVQDGEARSRFWREARALASLDDADIVRVYDFGETDEGALFLVMELVDGVALDVARAAGVADIVTRLARCSAALGVAHAAGLVHRDVKPSNVLVTAEGRVCLIDFGIARVAATDDDRVTSTGVAVGSPAYMAPEQLRGEPCTPATDVYAVGVMAFELLTGVHPFASGSALATAAAIERGTTRVPSELRPSIPAALDAVVMRCLSRDPEQRFVDGGELARALRDVDASAAPTTMARPRMRTRPLVMAAMACCVAAVLVAMAWNERRGAPTDDAHVASPEEVAIAPEALSVESVEAWVDRPPRPRVELRVRGDDAVAVGWIEHALWRTLDACPEHYLVSPVAGGGDATLTVEVAGRDDRLNVAVQLRVDDATIVSASLNAPAREVLASIPELGSFLAAELAPEGACEPAVPGTASVEAYEAWTRARAAVDEGVAEVDGEVAQALSFDAAFVAARLLEADLLRAARDHDEMGRRLRDLLASDTYLTPRERGLAEGLVDLAEGRDADAARAFEAVLSMWPRDTMAMHELLVLRFYGASTMDLAEAARLAYALLELDASDAVAASRYIRAMAWRGRADEARARLEALGALERDPTLRGELALTSGDPASAIDAFGEDLALHPEAPYSLHMQAVAQVLSGRCRDAAQTMLDRIAAEESSRGTGNQSWSYAILVSALLCDGRYAASREAIDRWGAGERGRDLTGDHLRWRVAWAAGQPPARIVDTARASLAASRAWDRETPNVLTAFALFSDDVEELDDLYERASDASVDLNRPRSEQLRYARASSLLAARRAELRGDAAASLELLATAIEPRADIRSESALVYRADAIAARALALERAGHQAASRALWTELADAPYETAYRFELVLQARRHLGMTTPTPEAP